MFQLGPGPVVWFISIEMFPQNASGAAQGIASFFNWFANTLVYLISPIALTTIKVKTLLIFIVLQIIISIYSVIFVVETYKKTPNQVIQNYGILEEKLGCSRKTMSPRDNLKANVLLL
uniref:Solute carrier family 2, facilitated glucose transporter member 3 (Trinotate prediction) n=1 Tax=Henneguya salminicola TaxID=69463 RepID=A0A6G3MLD9_HENSL